MRVLEELRTELEKLKGLFPEGPIPRDPTKIRFVLLLENERGELRRARCLQFNDLALHQWRGLPKDLFTDEAPWSECIKYMVENATPEDASAELRPND